MPGMIGGGMAPGMVPGMGGMVQIVRVLWAALVLQNIRHVRIVRNVRRWHVL